ncbi:Collagen alpha-1(XXI) chain [Collichthys lucidus]|uniref:Collagen alpha-1(XXI) chain n=1 Tax=Collichthys lucidus TaxID=240159 RepID=A0A4U5VEY2_COLLU|nr:Collagen alpha-1(XXI) chain [Collichthys lucidus]
MLVVAAVFAILGLTQCQKLPSFDLLEEFRVPESRGVRRVDGSQPEAVAFRVNPAIHLRKTMSDVYPDGLPSDYSVIATFKVTKDTAKKSWDLWQVSDPKGQEQVGLRFQGDTHSLDFFYTSPYGSQMLRTFHGVEKLFDGEWHKLALSVKGSKVKLLIDCEEVSVETIDEPRPVINRGYTSIVKRAARDRSVSVDLQQMEVSCDPEKAYSEGCCELSSVCGGYAEIGLTAGRASCKCLHGQPGVQGPPGPKGHRGLPGVSGDTGRLGNWGIRGKTGEYGNIGETGPKGEKGIKGEKGMRGLWGQVGDRGPKGLKGLKGAAGFKGVRGPPGDIGETGKQGEVVS